MVITVLQGEVEDKNGPVLVNAFTRSVSRRPPEIIQTYLVQDMKNPRLWNIITVWKSREDLEQMRKQGTPAGVLMFREAGAEPALSIYEVKAFSDE